MVELLDEVAGRLGQGHVVRFPVADGSLRDPKLSPESLPGEAQVLPELAKTLTRRGFLGHVTNSNKKNMAMFPGRLTLWMVTKGNR